MAELNEEGLRLDKWLWAARFFKTRAAAAEAVGGGKVHVNGQRVKPARTVHVGDELEIHRAQEAMSVTVRGINARRRPASEAQALYEEHETSRLAREQAREQRRLLNAAMPHPQHRPDKRERRRIRRFTGKD